MSRNLKALGLAFFAVFAMSAIAASAAHATEYFHQHEENTVITAANEGLPAAMSAPHKFFLTTALPAVECTSAKFEGTEVGLEKHVNEVTGTTWTKESLTVTPTYSGCSFNGNEAIVKHEECHFKLFAATTETVAGKAHGNVEVICPTGKTINISIPKLGVEIHVGSQLIPHAINYANVNTSGGTNGEEVTINTTAEKSITWSCTPKALCTTGLGVASGTEADYFGFVTAKGFKDLGEPPKVLTSENIYKEGEQRGIWKGPTL